MFGKKEVKKEWTGEEIRSILAKELSVEGDIKAQGKVRIDGSIKGNIDGDYVILSSSSLVEGDIKANVLIAQGKVFGNIAVKQADIRGTAEIVGDVSAEKLKVEAGASIKGQVLSGKFVKSPKAITIQTKAENQDLSKAKSSSTDSGK